MSDLLRVENLRVAFPGIGSTGKGEVLAGVDLAMEKGEAVALVGPSGCGKSILTRTLLGLLPPGATWEGSIIWRGEPLRDPSRGRWQNVRGRGMALVLQEPQTSLNPVLKVGEQIAETARVHGGLSWTAARRRAVQLLEEMLVPDPAAKAECYPHQLSGGMRQRVLLAAAMACDPALLIADEPTTALDVTVQKEILGLINRIRLERGMALLFITHDPLLVPLVATRRLEMSAGRITAVVDLDAPGEGAVQPPTGLLEGAGEETRAPDGPVPVLQARNLIVRYGVAKDRAPAPVDRVDIDLFGGHAFGLAGESGCGKTTLARALAGHLHPASGTLKMDGQDILSLGRGERRRRRRRVQMLFQDPGASLNPRQVIGRVLSEAAEDSDPALAARLLGEVDLPADLSSRYPHELSGGQRQRVALARCLAAHPGVLIADEPTSALDGAARDTILALLQRVMDRHDLALMVISHDLSVLHAICERVSVMYGGMIMESYRVPDRALVRHPYTIEMMAAAPAVLGRDTRLWLDAGSGVRKNIGPSREGCPRAGVCPLQKSHCNNELPRLKEVVKGHFLRCPEAEEHGPSQFIDT